LPCRTPHGIHETPGNDVLHAMWSIYKNALRDAFDQDRVAPRGARTTRAKRSPRPNQNDCASTSEQGGADAPAHGRDYALDERLTRPATLTDVQPARPRDRVGANPRQNVHGAGAHSARRFLHKSRQSPRQPAVLVTPALPNICHGSDNVSSRYDAEQSGTYHTPDQRDGGTSRIW